MTIQTKNHLLTAKETGHNKDLSKTNSGQPYRYPLAFFVSNDCLASQAKQTINTKPYPKITGVNRHIMPKMAINYDGATSQNKTAERRICGAVAICTESEPRHPIPIEHNQAYSVALTQKQIGGQYMPKSNQTPIHSNIPSTTTQAIFKAGDKVLCPTLGHSVHTLITDPHGRKHLLAINFDGSYFYYDKQGYFVRADATETMEFAPSLFANNPANHQAIATLFGNEQTEQETEQDKQTEQNTEQNQNTEQTEQGININKNQYVKETEQTEQTEQTTKQKTEQARKVIDLTDNNDDEVIVIGACEFSDIASAIAGTKEVLDDVSELLSAIHHGNLATNLITSLSRLTQYSTETCQQMLNHQLDELNKALILTKFGKVEG